MHARMTLIPRGLAAVAALLAVLACWPARGLCADLAELGRALAPGDAALSRLLPELDALAGPMSRDVLDGKADLHVFYGMAVSRILYEQCRETLSLMRSAKAQVCPALEAALTAQLGRAAARLEGAADLIEGSLPMTARSSVGILGRATVDALRLYLAPLGEFARAARGSEL